MIALEFLAPPVAASTLALMQSAATVADTVVTVGAPPTGLQWWVDLLTSIASIVIALALITIGIAVIPIAWSTRKLYKRINERVERFHGQLDPAIAHATDVMENLNYISSSIRQDVQELKGTIGRAQTRLDRAAGATEKRIQEFNSLLVVIQQEAEELFIDTASTVRGVRAGTEEYRRLKDRETAETDGATADLAGPARPPRRHP